VRKTESQKALVLSLLERNYPLVCQPTLGIVYKVGRLAARIKDLRDKGHTIRTEIRKTASGSRIAFYYLDDSP